MDTQKSRYFRKAAVGMTAAALTAAMSISGFANNWNGAGKQGLPGYSTESSTGQGMQGAGAQRQTPPPGDSDKKTQTGRPGLGMQENIADPAAQEMQKNIGDPAGQSEEESSSRHRIIKQVEGLDDAAAKEKLNKLIEAYSSARDTKRKLMEEHSDEFQAARNQVESAKKALEDALQDAGIDGSFGTRGTGSHEPQGQGIRQNNQQGDRQGNPQRNPQEDRQGIRQRNPQGDRQGIPQRNPQRQNNTAVQNKNGSQSRRPDRQNINEPQIQRPDRQNMDTFQGRRPDRQNPGNTGRNTKI